MRVGNEFSSKVKVLSGTPQGSILGPTYFTVFINDLPDCVKSTCKVFADDTKIYNIVSEKSLTEEDLTKVHKCSELWNLYFNVSKCTVMHVGKRNPKVEYTMKLNDD